METAKRIDSNIMRREDKCCVYIIEGLMGWCYCGISTRLVERMIEHNKGKSKSTRKNKPYVLKWVREFDSRRRARWVETLIKNTGVKSFVIRSKFQTNRATDKELMDFYVLEMSRYVHASRSQSLALANKYTGVCTF